MKPKTVLSIAVPLVAAAGLAMSFSTSAQSAQPTYQADPGVYKLIFEDQNYRVIEATRKKGVHDKVHGHPVASVIYNLTDCTTRTYGADGKAVDATSKAGSVRSVPATPSHSAENIGAADCRTIFVERK
jgi:hypothetical protein